MGYIEINAIVGVPKLGLTLYIFIFLNALLYNVLTNSPLYR